MCPVKYELGFYIPEDDILHSHCRENLKSYKNYVNSMKVGIPPALQPNYVSDNLIVSTLTDLLSNSYNYIQGFKIIFFSCSSKIMKLFSFVLTLSLQNLCNS
jgi:hypothetical protein